MPFTTFGLSDPLVRGILATGYTAPTEIQSQAIPLAISGRDIIGCAQTGTGKTAAFILPILDRLSHEPAVKKPIPRALILTPTRELAMQVENAIRGYGRFVKLRTLAVYGGVNIKSQLQKLKRGVDIVVATPGRLMDHMGRNSINLKQIEVLVLDEADRMLDMGFIRDVQKIVSVLPKKRQTMLFSATISKDVEKLAAEMQESPEMIQIGRPRNPIETITQHIYPVRREQKMDLLIHMLGDSQMFSVLVFSRTKRGADRINRRLKRAGIVSVAIHSGRTQNQRLQAMDGFKRGKYQVMVATDIAARGIDIEGISHVINYDVPAYAEDYVHRIGRTGRSTLVAGYNDGLLEFRDWQGTILSARSGFGQVKALAAGIVGSPPAPRLFVASTDSGGTLRAIELTNINRNIASRSNLGSVTALEICGGTDGAVYIGTSDSGGTLRKLHLLTLADQNTRRSMGNISKIIQMRGSWGDVLAVGTDSTGGSVHFVNRDTLADAVTRRQNLGRIYALSSGDMDQDGQAELIIASDASGGSIRLREGPNFSNNLAMRTGLGEIYALDYGPVGAESFAEPVGSAWLFFSTSTEGGLLNVMHVNIGPSNATFQGWAGLPNLGQVRYVELHDFYTVDTPLAGVILEGTTGPSLRVMDENLTESGTTPVPVATESFETGNFSRFPWQRSGNANWTITSQQKNSGLYSAKAGTISHNGSTTLEVKLNCVSGNITFYRKVSSEANFDFLKFYIDGVQKGSWSGEVNWAVMSFPVTAGQRTFRWTYSKDNSVSQGNDTAWIDDIVFPVSSTGVGLFSIDDEEHLMLEQPVQIDIEYEESAVEHE